ncbi:MAG TPA: F0F1 ATP synthase subunit B [Acidimicrobiales bacterium]|nr:F0F1 ATP synthase subunit B [Acidimicrobiales bacterium]
MRVRALIGAGVLVLASAFVLPGAALAQEEGEEHSEDISHEAELCIELLEKGGSEPEDCHEAPNLILPEANELIFGGLAFVILLAAMWKYAYPGIKKGMDARTQRIRDSLDDAERTKTEAQSVLEEYQRQLADARGESSRIIEEARQTAEQMRRDLMARAEAEVNDLRERTRQEIQSAQQRAVADLRAQVSDLAIGAAEVVVQKALDRETNRALVDSFIEQAGSRS